MKQFLLIWMLTAYGFTIAQQAPIETGADQLTEVVARLKGKRVAFMVNQTSVVGKTHLIDTLQSLEINIKKIFAVEHGFRGTADAGETIKDGADSKTKIPIVSLYGNTKRPTAAQLADVDVVVFDIQDVGVRFFTYISSLHYLMDACAEYQVPVLVLDRPNPHGSYVDGPMRQEKYKSFIGMHPVPVVHGMTIGEYANMINGEGWLTDKRQCNLEILKLKGWTHATAYVLPIRPSPNLPNSQSVALYPSTCFFEGTNMSVGRGTYHPFEWIGHPRLTSYSFSFTPKSIEGMAKTPPLKDTVCFGLNLEKINVKPGLNLSYIIELYNAYPVKGKFFNTYFKLLAGGSELQQQIEAGMSEATIKNSWQKELESFKKTRHKYLLYP